MSATEAPERPPVTAGAVVYLDRLGTPRLARGDAAARVRLVGVPATARQRLGSALGAELVEGDAAADVIVVSTRDPVAETLAVVAASGGVPVVVLAHAGGEASAADLVSAGATTVVGEGNEAAIAGVLGGDVATSVLLDAFENRFGHRDDADARGRDPITGLPDRSVFDRRVRDHGLAGDTPRVAFVRVLPPRSKDRPLSGQAEELLRRRLTAVLRPLVQALGGELFSLGRFDLAMLVPELSPNAVELLATRMRAAADTFVVAGRRFDLAVGHGGAELGEPLPVVVELARRALEVAATDRTTPVLSAEALALGVSTTTELEAVLRLLTRVEKQLPTGVGHGARVAAIAGELYDLLESEELDVASLRLAAHLHDVGRASLPPEALVSEPQDPELRELHRSYPLQSAAYLEAPAGRDVADLVRSHAERWDGAGFPDGLEGRAIPLGARLIALAHVVDEVLTADPDGDDEVIERLRRASGTVLDPELCLTAIAHADELRRSRLAH